MRIALSGLPWTVHSPSTYVLQSYPVFLHYNGEAWYFAINGDFDQARPWPSRDSAASAIADAFRNHEIQESIR